MDFGERLKNLRIEKGLTQEEVSRELFVPKQMVSKWENGIGLPDVASLVKLAYLMGVNVDYLLTGDKNVRIEKEIEIVEIEKEKIVEVDKPLSMALLKSLLNEYKRYYYGFYIGMYSGILYAILGIVLIIENGQHKSLLGLGILLIILSVGGLIAGILCRKKSVKQKKEIEEKTGKKASVFGYKDK